MVKQQKKATGPGSKKNEAPPSKKKGGGHKKKHEVKSSGGGGAKAAAAPKKESTEDRQRSYEHHDHCHKVQKKPTHTVPPKPSQFDSIGAMLAAEEIVHKKEVRQHHKELHRAQQPGLAH